MGCPHKPHARETVLLSKYFGDPEARTYKGWVKRGGYEAGRQGQTKRPGAVTGLGEEAGPPGRGRAGGAPGGEGGLAGAGGTRHRSPRVTTPQTQHSTRKH